MGVKERRIIYHPLFDCDVREAAGWYDRRSSGLGDGFVDAVRATVESIISEPERYALSENRIRYRRISRFPYVVLFDLIADTLYLLAVLHTARSSDKWRERFDDIGK